MAGLLRAPAAQRRWSARCAAVRPAGAPAHPRHPRRPAGDLRRGVDGRRRRGRRRGRAAGRHHQPALAVVDRRRGRAHRVRHRAVAGGGVRPRAVLGGAAPAVRAVRVRAAARRPGGSTATRSPAASCPTCASRRSRWASATGSRRSRTTTPPPTASSATRQGDPDEQGRRRPGAAPGGRRRQRRRVRRRPGTLRHPRLGDRLPARRARRPARRLARAVPHQGAGRAAAGQTHRGPVGRGRGQPARRRAEAAGHPEPAAVPRPDKGVRGASRASTATCRGCRPASSSTGCARGRAPRRSSSGAWSCSSGSRRSARPTSAACAP